MKTKMCGVDVCRHIFYFVLPSYCHLELVYVVLWAIYFERFHGERDCSRVWGRVWRGGGGGGGFWPGQVSCCRWMASFLLMACSFVRNVEFSVVALTVIL